MAFISVGVEGIESASGDQSLFEPLDEYLDQFNQRIGTMAASLMANMGRAALKEVKKNFEREVDPDGMPWFQLSPKYAAWKAQHASGKKKLHLTEQLFDSLDIRYGADFVDIGVIDGPPWAAIHNFGGDTGNAYIPRREYAGTSDAFIDELIDSIYWYTETGEWMPPAG